MWSYEQQAAKCKTIVLNWYPAFWLEICLWNGREPECHGACHCLQPRKRITWFRMCKNQVNSSLQWCASLRYEHTFCPTKHLDENNNQHHLPQGQCWSKSAQRTQRGKTWKVYRLKRTQSAMHLWHTPLERQLWGTKEEDKPALPQFFKESKQSRVQQTN